MLIGVGVTRGSAIDAANILKLPLAKGELKVTKLCCIIKCFGSF